MRQSSHYEGAMPMSNNTNGWITNYAFMIKTTSKALGYNCVVICYRWQAWLWEIKVANDN